MKNLLEDSKWLLEAQGKAVKIVVPPSATVPAELACRVILCERNLDEVLDSQSAAAFVLQLLGAEANRLKQ